MPLYYAQSLSQQQITNSGGWDYISGLGLTLPTQLTLGAFIGSFVQRQVGAFRDREAKEQRAVS